nr:unnamed protein product [Digitaria exilis]
MEEIWGSDCHEFTAGAVAARCWPISASGRTWGSTTLRSQICLGKNLGLNNIKIAAAAILYNFQVELVDGAVVKPQNSVVLHTKNGMRVRIKRRKAA